MDREVRSFEYKTIRDAACALLHVDPADKEEIKGLGITPNLTSADLYKSIKENNEKLKEGRFSDRIVKDAAHALIRYDTWPHDYD